MPEAIMAVAAHERTGDVPAYAINCYPEEVETPDGKRVQLRQRPGLASFETVGSGILRGMHQRDGLFGDAALVVSGTEVYTLTASGTATLLTGSVAGTALVDIDSALDANLDSLARIATGNALYKVLNGVVTQEAFPASGGAGASSVCFHRSFWFATEAGTDQVYYLPPGSSTWTALSFASAEYAPDPLIAVRSVGDLLVLLGSSTFEVWTVSSGTPAPFGGLAFNVGARARASTVVCGETLIFVDNQCRVQRWEGGALDNIADHGLTEQIAAVAAADLSAWYLPVEGHRFLPLHLGSEATHVYDLDSPADRWSKWESPTLDYWRGRVGCTISGSVLAGDAIDQTVWRLDPTRRTDGATEFPMEWSAIIPAREQPQPIANMVLISDLGDAPRSGQGSTPQVMARWSDDQGKTWNNWKYRPMGATGHYGVFPRWNGCGRVPANMPRVIRMRISDPIGRVIRAIRYNT